MSFGFRLTAEALDDLARLDKPTAQRMLSRIRWLADNAEHVSRESLSGSFSAYFKFRVGDYRVLYLADDNAKELVVHT